MQFQHFFDFKCNNKNAIFFTWALVKPESSQNPSEQYTIGNDGGTWALPRTKLLSAKKFKYLFSE